MCGSQEKDKAPDSALVLSFCVGSRGRTEVIRLGGRSLQLPSALPTLSVSLFLPLASLSLLLFLPSPYTGSASPLLAADQNITQRLHSVQRGGSSLPGSLLPGQLFPC